MPHVIERATTGEAKHGVFTSRPGTLSNDYFVNLLDMNTLWSKSATAEGIYEGKDRATGTVKWTASPVDLLKAKQEVRAGVAVLRAADEMTGTILDVFA